MRPKESYLSHVDGCKNTLTFAIFMMCQTSEPSSSPLLSLVWHILHPKKKKAETGKEATVRHERGSSFPSLISALLNHVTGHSWARRHVTHLEISIFGHEPPSLKTQGGLKLSVQNSPFFYLLRSWTWSWYSQVNSFLRTKILIQLQLHEEKIWCINILFVYWWYKVCTRQNIMYSLDTWVDKQILYTSW